MREWMDFLAFERDEWDRLAEYMGRTENVHLLSDLLKHFMERNYGLAEMSIIMAQDAMERGI